MDDKQKSRLDANHQKLWNEFEKWKLEYEIEFPDSPPKTLDGQLVCFLMQRVSNLEMIIFQQSNEMQIVKQLFSNMMTHKQGAKLLLPNI